MRVGIDLGLKTVAGRAVRIDITHRAIGIVEKTLVGDAFVVHVDDEVLGQDLDVVPETGRGRRRGMKKK